jgi:hypothetical protein
VIRDIKTGFCWKLIVVYGSSYENGKTDFLEELHVVIMHKIDGDFNVVRFAR